jgi:hypothetical protein
MAWWKNLMQINYFVVRQGGRVIRSVAIAFLSLAIGGCANIDWQVGIRTSLEAACEDTRNCYQSCPQQHGAVTAPDKRCKQGR